MSQLFTRIDPVEIERLDSHSLVRLLNRLLHCEALYNGLSATNILVPVQITVPDGGRDGTWDASAAIPPYIPKQLTFFQCKAELVTSKKCVDEIVVSETKKGVTTTRIKDRVKEVLDKGGCYCFFSSKHEVKPDVHADLATVAVEALKEQKYVLPAGAAIEFHGSNKVADWVNKFPAAVRYVREQTGGLHGLHYSTISDWSRHRSTSGVFYSTSRLEAVADSIRRELVNGRTTIRITGLSGLGKTRFVFDTLNSASAADPRYHAIAESAIYLNYGDAPDSVIGFVSQLAGSKYAAIIAVDDCPPDKHRRLADIVHNSKVSLITVYHQAERYQHDDIGIVLTPEDMTDVVSQILAADPQLSAMGSQSLDAVNHFTRGFPSMARLIAKLKRSPTLEELQGQDSLFHKLISGGDAPDAQTLTVMQALSLFRTIGGSAESLDRHLEAIRETFCPDLPELAFRGLLETQLRREVLQKTADTMMVTPRPLGVALAASFIQAFPSKRWAEAIGALERVDLVGEFTDRLEELEFSERAQEIGQVLLEKNFPFREAEYLVSGESPAKVFRALTSLNPSVGIKVMESMVRRCSREMLLAARSSRREFVRSCEIAAWERAGFDGAVRVLFRLADAENERWTNNATGVLNQLFELYLSGTRVPASDRVEVLREACLDQSPAIRMLAATAAGHGLISENFSRTSLPSLSGKRAAERDWKPANRTEVTEYQVKCFDILCDFILRDRAVASHAKAVVEKRMAAILNSMLLEDRDESFRALADHFQNYWPSVRQSIRDLVDDDELRLNDRHRAALDRWMGYVTPAADDFERRIGDIVSQPGWRHKRAGDGGLIDVSRVEVLAFADEVVSRRVDVSRYVKLLLAGVQQQAFSFGMALGEKSSEALPIFRAAVGQWVALGDGEKNPSFLLGLGRGISAASAMHDVLLDCLRESHAVKDLLVPVCSAFVGFSAKHLTICCEAVIDGSVDSRSLQSLVPGQPLRQLDSGFVASSFLKVYAKRPESAAVLLDIISVHLHDNDDDVGAFDGLLKELLVADKLPFGDQHFVFTWNSLFEKVLSSSVDHEWLRTIAGVICNAVLESDRAIMSDRLAEAVSKLFEIAPLETWSVFSEAMNSDDDLERWKIEHFVGSMGNVFSDTKSPLWKLPAETLRSWASENRTAVCSLLRRMSLFTVDDSTELKWHPHVILLSEYVADVDALVRAIAGNMMSFGSSGSRVPYLERRRRAASELLLQDSAMLKLVGRELEVILDSDIEAERRRELNERAKEWLE